MHFYSSCIRIIAYFPASAGIHARYTVKFEAHIRTSNIIVSLSIRSIEGDYVATQRIRGVVYAWCIVVHCSQRNMMGRLNVCNFDYSSNLVTSRF